MSDITKMFVGASLEDAEGLAEWADEIKQEYIRFLRLKGLAPIEEERTDQALQLQAEILVELEELEKPIQQRKEAKRDVIQETSRYFARMDQLKAEQNELAEWKAAVEQDKREAFDFEDEADERAAKLEQFTDIRSMT